MDQHTTESIRRWFTAFVRTFDCSDEEAQRNYRLKEEHTFRVEENAVLIARGLGLGAQDRGIAAIAGILHDTGRFPQYRDHRTFRDSISVNHAAVGARIIIEQGVLDGLEQEERDIVTRSVTLHNVFTLPSGLPDRLALHARIIRDADKLDIWRVFCDILALPEQDRPSAAGLGLPERGDCSPAVIGHLMDGRMVKLDELANLNDFVLLQLAWVYDLNFAPSFRLVRERDIIDRLAAALPRQDGLRRAVETVRRHVDEQARQAV